MQENVGCEHNINRVFNYPDSIIRNKVQRTIEDEDVIKLLCPAGCNPVIIVVKSNSPKTL